MDFRTPIIDPQAMQALQDKVKQEDFYKEETLRLLNSIKNNTDSLTNIVDLITTSNEKQDEIIEIFNEFLQIATIKNDPDKARSLYKQVMGKIHDITNDGEVIMRLVNFGMLIGNILHANGILWITSHSVLELNRTYSNSHGCYIWNKIH